MERTKRLEPVLSCAQPQDASQGPTVRAAALRIASRAAGALGTPCSFHRALVRLLLPLQAPRRTL
jgi:hypothetical protein